MGGDGVEHWEYLKPDGLRFVWDDTLFRPGTDSFLLSSLPKLSAGLRVCDLGCGTGLLGLLLLQRQSELTITGIDIQPAAVALAERAAAENRLTDRLTFQCIDLRQVRQHFSTGSFDLVVCNPPYYPPACGKVSADNARRTARSETEASLADICAAASYLLRWGGKFCLVHKPERLTDTACALREAGMETADVARLYLAGGFGSAMRPESAARIGLIPEELSDRVTVLGNAAGSGALRYATEEGAAESALGIIRRTRYIELSAHAGFTDAYVERMLFPERE